MNKLIVFLIITLMTLTGCSSDGVDNFDIYGGGEYHMDLDFEVFSDPLVGLWGGCSSDNTTIAPYVLIAMSCEGFKELMVDNTPPNKCDEITIIDKDGVSFTGFLSLGYHTINAINQVDAFL